MEKNKHNKSTLENLKSLDKKKIIVFIVAILVLLVISVSIILAFFIDKDTKSNSFIIKAEYSVKFDSNGGEGEMADQMISYNIGTNLMPNTYTKSEYLFDKWNTKADGTGDSYTDEQSVTNLDDIILYAQWKYNDITPPSSVTFTVGTITDDSITITAEASDNIGIKYLDFSSDGGTTYPESNRQTIENPISGSISKSFTFSGLNPNTNYNIKIKATDEAGNYLESSLQQKKTNPITADMLEFSPSDSNWKSLENTTITNSKQALDYLYANQ